MKALLYVTNFCNLQCEHCYWTKAVSKKDFGLQEWMRAIDVLVEKAGVNKIVFLGGEPMTFKQMPKLTAYAMMRVPTINIQTNGVFVNQTWIDYVTGYAKHEQCLCPKPAINISLEDSTEEGNARLREADTFKLIQYSVKRYAEQGFPVIIRTTLTKYTDVQGLIDLALAYGVSWVGVRFVELGAATNKSDLMPSAARLREIYDLVLANEERARQKGVALHVEDNQFYIYNRKLFDEKKARLIENKRICPAGVAEIGVTPQGDVFACHLVYDKTTPFYLGNILQDDWNAIDAKRRKFDEWRNSLGYLQACQACELKKLCRGGCTLYALKTGKLGDPSCPLVIKNG